MQDACPISTLPVGQNTVLRAAGCLGALLCWHSPIAAQEPLANPVGSYRAPPDCPDQTAFLREVAARATSGSVERVRAAAERVAVSIRRTDKNLLGSVTFVSGDERRVQGESCNEVVQALALVVALQLKSSEPIVDEPSPPSPDQPPLPPTRREMPPVPRSARIEASPTSTARLVTGSVTLLPTAARRSARWTWGAGGITAHGVSPGILLDGSLFLERAQLSKVAYSFLVSAEGTPRFDFDAYNGARSSFQWWAGRTNACLGAINHRNEFLLWLCAEAVGGLTIAEGQVSGPITTTRTQHQAWFSLGPSTRLRADLEMGLSLELAASLSVPLLRYETSFSSPDIPVYTTKLVAGFLQFRIGSWGGGSKRPTSAIASQ